MTPASLRFFGGVIRFLRAASASLRFGVARPLPWVVSRSAGSSAAGSVDVRRPNTELPPRSSQGDVPFAQHTYVRSARPSSWSSSPLPRRVVGVRRDAARRPLPSGSTPFQEGVGHSMSSIMQRIALIFRSKANTALDKAEDPRETLDYSYVKQQELLQKVRRGVADVATSRKRIELQINQLDQSAQKLQGQAQTALAAGREDLAREALTRKSGIQQQIADLQAQHTQLQGEEEKLTNASQRLQARVESFRTKKE